MFQRFRNAIDARIAEEQARQQSSATLTSQSSKPPVSRSPSSRPGASPSTRRSVSQQRAGVSSQRESSLKEDRTGEPSLAGKEPDPAEFDPKFVIGEEDDGLSTEIKTPVSQSQGLEQGRIGDRKPDEEHVGQDGGQDRLGALKDRKIIGNEGDEKRGNEERVEDMANKGSKDAKEERTEKQEELNPDIRSKLRRLDKLEPKYQELLKSYRVAHARVKAIEPFEASLRENTPLRSIGDPTAFVEYLNQVNAKNTLLLDELRRVTADRDEFKKRFIDVEKQQKNNETKDRLDSVSAKGESTTEKLDTESKATEESEELFSVDAELPRLQADLHQLEANLKKTKSENEKLKADLSVAKESAERLVRNLETSTADLQNLRDTKERTEKELTSKCRKLETASAEATEKLKFLEEQHDKQLQTMEEEQKENTHVDSNVQQELEKLKKSHAEAQKRVDTMSSLMQSLRSQISALEKEKETLVVEREALRGQMQKSVSEESPQTDKKLQQDKLELESTHKAVDSSQADSTKKRSKKKKKGKGRVDDNQCSVIPDDVTKNVKSTNSLPDKSEVEHSNGISDPTKELESVRRQLREKEGVIENLRSSLKDQDELHEEIEGLRDNLVHVGQDHVEAKEMIKKLEEDKMVLRNKINSLEKEAKLRDEEKASTYSDTGNENQALRKEIEELQSQISTMEIDLKAAHDLAAARYKELANLKDALQKARQELTTLRQQLIELESCKDELASNKSRVKTLEGSEKTLQSQISSAKTDLKKKEDEVKKLNEKLKQDNNYHLALEESSRRAKLDLEQSESTRQEAIERQEKLGSALAKAQNELREARGNLVKANNQVEKLNKEAENLNEDIQLKSAQYASAQSLMNSLQDQTHEMGAKVKEVNSRCESLEEELTDSHRLLSERSREGETMRRLLADAEHRAEAKVKTMREQLNLAVEERDRAEEEASTIGRRRLRELEELKDKVHVTEQALTGAKEEKEEIIQTVEGLKIRQKDAEEKAARLDTVADEARQAMGELRDGLNSADNHAREAEREKLQIKESFEEAQIRLEKLQKSSKIMAEELRTLQNAKSRAAATAAVIEAGTTQSSRTSVESTSSTSRTATNASSQRSLPSPPSKQTAAGDGKLDHVYLKNVLLQFMEQKDKRHQMQLVPVLGMLLHFDKKDEQKWMAAITTK